MTKINPITLTIAGVSLGALLDSLCHVAPGNVVMFGVHKLYWLAIGIYIGVQSARFQKEDKKPDSVQ